MLPEPVFEETGRSGRYLVYIGGECVGLIVGRASGPGSRSVNKYIAFRVLSNGRFSASPAAWADPKRTEWTHHSRKDAARALVTELFWWDYGREMLRRASDGDDPLATAWLDREEDS